MKQIILLLIIVAPLLSRAQIWEADARALSSGGSIVSNAEHSGMAAFGLPFVGTLTNEGFKQQLGLYGVETAHDTLRFAVAPSAIDFGITATDSITTRVFTITNRSSGELAISGAISDAHAPFMFTGRDFALGKNGSDTFTVSFAPTLPGNFADSIAVTAGGQEIIIRLTGRAEGADVDDRAITEREIPLYPNPSTGTFRIGVSEEDVQPVSATLYSDHGVLIEELTDIHRVTPSEIEFTLKRIPKGSYMLALLMGKNTISYKLIIY